MSGTSPSTRPHLLVSSAFVSDERPAGTPVRVLVLTAPVGEGHVAAARAIASGIRRQNADAEVVVLDVLPALPRPLRWLLSDAYRWQLQAAPWLFGLLFAALERSRLLRRLASSRSRSRARALCAGSCDATQPTSSSRRGRRRRTCSVDCACGARCGSRSARRSRTSPGSSSGRAAASICTS